MAKRKTKRTPKEKKEALDQHLGGMTYDLFSRYDAPLRELQDRMQEDLVRGLLLNAFESLKFEFRRNELLIRIPLDPPPNPQNP